jgi:branched-chain amino acid transport system substrate-binding protein
MAADKMHRRDFLATLGITVGGAALGVGDLAVAGPDSAQVQAKGRVLDTPVKFGHITILSGPGAILGAPSLKGHTLAAEEINAMGGLLGRRKIETVVADEAAGPEATVKELKRMKLSERIDYFSGIIAAHNQLAVGPVVEELKLLTIMTEGCIDKLFEIEVPRPHYLFGMTNILSADGVTTALAIAKAWPDVKRIAVIHPDYAFGRWFQLHFEAAREKLLPASEIVSEVWAPLGNTDFNSHIVKTAAARPDIVVTAMWGGMYVAFYKQALGHGLFNQARLAGNINFGVVPQAIGKDHPEGALAGVHSNYHFTYPPANQWAPNKTFVERYFQRWKEYPNYVAEAAYTGLHLFKTAVEKAHKQAGGGWPEDDAVIGQLEGLSINAPAGVVTVRKEDHRAFKDVKTGFSKNLPGYPFPVWDPDRIMTIPVASMTAPPTWPKPGKGHNDPSATVNWIRTTWPKAGG